MPTASGNVRVRGQSAKHLLVLSSSQLDPSRTSKLGRCGGADAVARHVLQPATAPPCGLPIFGIVFCLGQFSDVMCDVAERGSLQCARFEITLERLEGWRQEQVTWFLAIPYLPKVMR